MVDEDPVARYGLFDPRRREVGLVVPLRDVVAVRGLLEFAGLLEDEEPEPLRARGRRRAVGNAENCSAYAIMLPSTSVWP